MAELELAAPGSGPTMAAVWWAGGLERSSSFGNRLRGFSLDEQQQSSPGFRVALAISCTQHRRRVETSRRCCETKAEPI